MLLSIGSDVTAQSDLIHTDQVTSMGTIFTPFIPYAGESYLVTTERSAPDDLRSIFRSNVHEEVREEKKEPDAAIDFTDFFKLCRCSAWSKDSENSPHVVSPVQESSHAVHWDDVVVELGNITASVR